MDLGLHRCDAPAVIDLVGIHQGHGHNGNLGFGGGFEAAGLEIPKPVVFFVVVAALGENDVAAASLHFFGDGIDHLQLLSRK